MFTILAVSEGNKTSTLIKLLNEGQNTKGYKECAMMSAQGIG